MLGSHWSVLPSIEAGTAMCRAVTLPLHPSGELYFIQVIIFSFDDVIQYAVPPLFQFFSCVQFTMFLLSVCITCASVQKTKYVGMFCAAENRELTRVSKICQIQFVS